MDVLVYWPIGPKFEGQRPIPETAVIPQYLMDERYAIRAPLLRFDEVETTPWDLRLASRDISSNRPAPAVVG